MRDATEAALMAAADRLSERVATVHERHQCPRCGMPEGVRCIAMRAGGFSREPAVEVKHPHMERLREDGIYSR
jgi:predicted RNA-binding Zn-ribbon protein involved in translation (DUF1610 family)